MGISAAARAEFKRVRFFSFSVEDSGIGIDEEGRARLFQEFSQVDTSTTRKYGGTGLGLFICRQLVELHGGFIEAESTVGRGSVFTFVIPFRAPSAEQLRQGPRYPGTGPSQIRSPALRTMEGGTASDPDSDDDELDGAQGEDDGGTECAFRVPSSAKVSRVRVCLAKTDGAVGALLRDVVQGAVRNVVSQTSVVLTGANADVVTFLRDSVHASAGTVSVLVVDEHVSSPQVLEALASAKAGLAGKSDAGTLVTALDVLTPLDNAARRKALQAGWDHVLVRPILPITMVDMLSLAAEIGTLTKGSDKHNAAQRYITLRGGRTGEDAMSIGAGTPTIQLSTKGAGDGSISFEGGRLIMHSSPHGRSSSHHSATGSASGTGSVDNVSSGVVLVVDDFDLMREVVSTAVQSLGYKTLTAADGAEAVAMVTDPSLNIVAIFMDCEMPIMDGFEATRTIREHERKNKASRAVPIIACTGNAMQEDRRKCMDAGMTDFASKPLQRTVIANLLEVHVRRATARAQKKGKRGGAQGGGRSNSTGATAPGDSVVSPRKRIAKKAEAASLKKPAPSMPSDPGPGEQRNQPELLPPSASRLGSNQSASRRRKKKAAAAAAAAAADN